MDLACYIDRGVMKMVPFPVFRFREDYAASAGPFFVVIGEKSMSYGLSYTIVQFHRDAGTGRMMPSLIRELSYQLLREQTYRLHGIQLKLDEVIELLIQVWNTKWRRGGSKGGVHMYTKYMPAIWQVVGLKSNAPMYVEYLRNRGLTLSVD